MGNSTKKILGVPLTINGHTLNPLEDSVYEATAGQLGVTDFSILPVGIKLHIKGAATSMSSIPVSVLWIDVEPGHIAATGIACQVARGWKYALARAKYWSIGAVLLNGLEANRSDFIYDGKVTDGLLFTQTFKAGSLPDVDDQVRDIVGKALQPLLDFREAMDAESFRRFGV